MTFRALLLVALLCLAGCSSGQTHLKYQIPAGTVIVVTTDEALQVLAEMGGRKIPKGSEVRGLWRKGTGQIYLGQEQQAATLDHELEHLLGIRPPEPVEP